MSASRELGASKHRSPGRPRYIPLAAALLLPFALTAVLAPRAWAQEPGARPIETAARSKVPAAPSQQAATPNRGSATPELVTFQDGQLSINASNVSLSDVLFAVRAATGADIDVPLNASSERVTAQLGPGPARKVLADLLGWSSFDYIIQGSDDDPLAVQSITLMIRIKSGTPATSAVAASANPRSNYQNPSRPEPENTSAPASDPPAAVEPHPDQPVAAAAPDNPDPPASVQPKVQPVATQPWGSGSAAGKSPSDMIQELQQMYQQRRQLQEQQNQASGQRTP
jgi:hypothetical protein